MSAPTVLQQENAELRRALNAGAEAHYEDMRRIRQLADALRVLTRLDVKGHALIDRLQFSDAGRALVEQVKAALAFPESAGGGL